MNVRVLNGEYIVRAIDFTVHTIGFTHVRDERAVCPPLYMRPARWPSLSQIWQLGHSFLMFATCGSEPPSSIEYFFPGTARGGRTFLFASAVRICSRRSIS